MTDGCETDSNTSITNCGGCGIDCAAIAPPNMQPTVCSLGVCQYTCAAGFADCDGVQATGCEIDLDTDEDHCGACNAACSTIGGSPTCTLGVCSMGCNVGLDDCSANEDAVRHQWMVHGLPNYLYPMGMFHIEASGGQTVRGTFIVPAEDRTYLIHCDMAQHMEKGMRGQLVVGAGSGNLWGVPGVSDWFYRADYFPQHAPLLAVVVALTGFLLTHRLFGKDRGG